MTSLFLYSVNQTLNKQTEETQHAGEGVYFSE